MHFSLLAALIPSLHPFYLTFTFLRFFFLPLSFSTESESAASASSHFLHSHLHLHSTTSIPGIRRTARAANFQPGWMDRGEWALHSSSGSSVLGALVGNGYRAVAMPCLLLSCSKESLSNKRPGAWNLVRLSQGQGRGLFWGYGMLL